MMRLIWPFFPSPRPASTTREALAAHDLHTEVNAEPARGPWAGKSYPVWILTLLLFAVVVNIAVAAFVRQERTVYFWDWRTYWHRVQTATAAVEKRLGIRDDIISTSVSDSPETNMSEEHEPNSFAIFGLERLSNSILNDEYNKLPVLPLLPWTLTFGADRLPYVLGVLNVYAIPAVFLLCIFCYRYPMRLGALNDHWRIWVPLVLIAGFPLFWAPIVRGMLDVVTLACNLLVLLIYFSRPPKELRWPALLAMGLLLAGSVLLRRWNAYWSVSFLVIIGLDGLVSFLGSRDRSPAHLLGHLRPSLVAGGAALAILVAVAGPLAIRMATTDYADRYDAYKLEQGVFPVLAALGRDIGYFWIALFLLSAAALVWGRETRRLALILAGQCILVVVWFARTQSFSVHHYYLLQPGILITCSLFVLQMLARWSSAWSRGVALGLMVAIAGLIDVSMFVPRATALHAGLRPLVPRNAYYPLVRHDVAELEIVFMQL